MFHHDPAGSSHSHASTSASTCGRYSNPCFFSSKSTFFEDETESVTACEGEELEIRCERGHGILVNSAMFGRTPEGNDRCPAYKTGAVECLDTRAVYEVRGRCKRKRACTLQANESIFGNPCPADVNKFLTVSYSCVPKSILKKRDNKERRRKNKERRRKKNKRKRKKNKKKKNKKLQEQKQAEFYDTTVLSTGESRDQTTDQSEGQFQESYEQTSVTQSLPSDPYSLEETTTEDRGVDYEGNNNQALLPTEAAGDAPDVTLGPFKETDNSTSKESDHSPSLDPWDREDVFLATTEMTTVGQEEGSEVSTEGSQGSDVVTLEERDRQGDVTHDVTEGTTEPGGFDGGQKFDGVTEDTDTAGRPGVSDKERGGETIITEATADKIQESSSIQNNGNSDRFQGSDKTDPSSTSGYSAVTSDPGPVHGKGQGRDLRGQPDSGDESSTPALSSNVRDTNKHHNDGARKSITRPREKPDKTNTEVKVKAKAKGKDETSSQDGGGSPYVTERNLTVLCVNYTGSEERKKDEVNWATVQRPRDERTIGFLKDWFTVIHYLDTHEEKAWLYFTLGICFGIIVMLVVVLVKVCVNFRRNIRARLDVSDPTHRSAHINNHHHGPDPLDAPMLEHSDSIDRIEVVRFSPRSTLRSMRGGARENRDLVNYYG
ncbi:Eva-1 homolog a [Plakobranchus ocellatus]|uniref:Eva-1 homolog a n=1 Tax=Plakobranchus ocellatus TaxID=259542 RepID=A0AAV4A8C1_9GAST|nr:Eva-1 homolog a [Plakobranchus ocellatus]